MIESAKKGIRIAAGTGKPNWSDESVLQQRAFELFHRLLTDFNRDTVDIQLGLV
jgi:hypothetical protein